jgi:hypothetical protein
MNNKIKNILIRNSDLLKKNKINLIKLFNNYQTGGEKDLSVSYNDKKYIFIKSYDKTCQYFSMFYEELYNKIRVYEPHREFYGLVL